MVAEVAEEEEEVCGMSAGLEPMMSSSRPGVEGERW
jgi:hypothetical protein